MEFGDNEIWRAIDGYVNYDVSTHGRVRNNKTGLLLKNCFNDRYYKIRLYNNGASKLYLIHRLVAEAFCENINNYNVVDHIDRNTKNNFYKNLRWCTTEINGKNKKIKSDNNSGITGIFFDPSRNKWRAIWHVNKKQKAKRFNNKDDAINFRKEMEQLHGYICDDNERL